MTFVDRGYYTKDRGSRPSKIWRSIASSNTPSSIPRC